MWVQMGNCEFQGTNGVLLIDGDEQVTLEIGENDGALLVTMDIYDEKGVHVAKLRKNVWTFHHGDLFDARSGFDENAGAGTFGMKERATGVRVLNGAAFTKHGAVIISDAHFWTKRGQLVKIDEHGDLHLGRSKFSRLLSVNSGPIVLNG